MKMFSTRLKLFFQSCYVLLLILLINSTISAGTIKFDSDKWELKDAEIIQYLGRKALMGSAILKDIEFENGIIEVDIAVTGARSYPGINFRIQSEDNYERFYIRPHRAGMYPDALQYTPVFNKVAGWQLYNGKGFTAGANIPTNQWIHLKIEIYRKQARVFINNGKKPSLIINDLKHGIGKGGLGLIGPKNGTAYFSNFSYQHNNDLQFEAPPEIEKPEGILTDWELSKTFKAGKIDIELISYPRFYQIFYAGWREVKAEVTGLVDITRYAQRSQNGPDCIMARTIVRSEKQQSIRLNFGYSDEISVFLNGKKMFYGMSAYRYRDPSFLGIIGLNDAVFLELEKGLNEIYFLVKESFGGWGFMAKTNLPLEAPIKNHDKLTKVWETEKVFLTPESVLYDPTRELLYVSSFDNRYKKNAAPEEYTGFISKVKLNGEIINLKWITGLHAPCGMGIFEDNLYTVERGHLVEIDIKTGKILNRFPVPDSDFLNDLAIDEQGNIYMTDTRPSSNPDSRIYRFTDGRVKVWLEGEDINWANGLFYHDNKLLIGNSGDGCLKSIDIETKKVEKIACLGAGILDGIRVDGEGNYLVSHWEGQTYLISPDGKIVELMDTIGDVNSADFEYIKEKNLLIIPTFVGNRVVAYKLEK
jgi:sugar lactone lactonase YvrE